MACPHGSNAKANGLGFPTLRLASQLVEHVLGVDVGGRV
jgi:hypothetical protein